jgi:hypothetical protein
LTDLKNEVAEAEGDARESNAKFSEALKEIGGLRRDLTAAKR